MENYMKRATFNKMVTIILIIVLSIPILLVLEAIVFPKDILYWPGRDTLLYWNKGKFELMRDLGNNETAYLNRNNWSDDENNVEYIELLKEIVCFTEVNNIIFFITKDGYALLDLNSEMLTITTKPPLLYAEVFDSANHEKWTLISYLVSKYDSKI